MKCEDFEQLLADALGDELAEADRAAFEAHLAECDTCRHEYKSNAAAVQALKGMGGPQEVRVRREGERLIIEGPETLSAVDAAQGTIETVGPSHGRTERRMSALFRYAASLLIAFVGGYALHAGLMLSTADHPGQNGPGTPLVAQTETPTFQAELLRAHQRNPAGSGLSKCMMVLLSAQR